jgi:hypothetical protein
MLDAVDEARQGALDAHAQGAAEGAFEGPRVGRDLPGDRGDHVLREIGQRRPQRGGERGRKVVCHFVGTRLQIRRQLPYLAVEKCGDPVP